MCDGRPDPALRLLLRRDMRGTIWVTDREPGVRLLFGEFLAEASLIDPDELRRRLKSGERPDALVIDGTQLLELAPRQRSAVLRLPRVLVCTGLPLVAIPMSLISGPGVSVLAKPFCVEDLEIAIEWLRGAPAKASMPQSPRAGHVRPMDPSSGAAPEPLA
jgi:hypothetical protein